ncbi:MAG: ABC transporter permease subunit [Candidatus Eiseniibacteriota bacterium]
MNRTLIFHTILQRAVSPRGILVLLLLGFPVLLVAFEPRLGFSMMQSGGVFAVLLGAGLIGQDISSGVLGLLFARPVTRSAYVLSRWFGVGAFAAGAVILQLALGSLAMTIRGAPPALDLLARTAIEQLLAVFGTVAVFTLLSSLLPAVVDLVVWALLHLGAGALAIAGGIAASPVLLRASREMSRFLSPGLDLKTTLGGGVLGWFDLVSYLSTVTLCLAVAIVILNRREFSYATD